MKAFSTIKVLFATETGNSEEAASYLNRELKRHRIYSEIENLENVKTLDRLTSQFDNGKTAIIFVVSTCGQGEVPKTIKKLWMSLLQKSLSVNQFSGFAYSVFGLGDSAYVSFNFAARKVWKRLEQLGAQPFFRIGYGDEQSRFQFLDGLEIWAKQCCESIRLKMEIKFPVFGKSHVFPSVYNVEKLSVDRLEKIDIGCDIEKPSAIVSDIRKLTSEDHFQKVYQITFDFGDKPTDFDSGDVLEIYPLNKDEDAMKLINLLELKKDGILKIWKSPKEKFCGKLLNFGGSLCISAFDLFKEKLEIAAVPKKDFFETMLCFSKSKMETEKLKEFVSPEGIFELNKFCQQERRTFFEVIESFPSSIPPLEYIIEKIPPIKPRFFTISSSSLKSPKAEITAAIVDYKTPYKRMKVGVCSDYLQNLQRGDKVHALVTKGSFVKPKNFLDTPLIGIGPGTGLAPLKAMAEERYFSREKFEKMALFLGHRYRNKDYLYGKNYWPQYKRVFEHFSVAFSRESGLKKHYVTHDLKTNSKLIWNLINGGALVFISGNAKQMPSDVKETLRFIFEKEGNLSATKAQEFLNRLVNRRIVQMEVW